MESFSEDRFPTDISYGISGGPSFKTDIVTTSSGYEYRNICHIHPRYKYHLASAIKTEEQLLKVVSFFKAMRGKAIGFRFKDWSDYKVTNQEIAVADGEQSIFQLYKIYTSGSVETRRDTTKPVSGTISVFINNKSCEHYEVNYKTGELIFKEPPQAGAVIKVSFEFDVPVRFDNDTILTTIQNYGVQLVEDIALIEVYV
jgi:uncharacterized protein (TIGR02217 family)